MFLELLPGSRYCCHMVLLHFRVTAVEWCLLRVATRRGEARVAPALVGPMLRGATCTRIAPCA